MKFLAICLIMIGTVLGTHTYMMGVDYTSWTMAVIKVAVAVGMVIGGWWLLYDDEYDVSPVYH